MKYILGDQEPISALVAYEFGVPKSAVPSPFPPPPSTKSKGKGKGKKKGTKSRAIPADAEQFTTLDSTPGFCAPVQGAQEDEISGRDDWSPVFLVHPDAPVGRSDTHPTSESKGKKGKSKAKARPTPTPIPIPTPGSSGLENEPQLIETIDKQQSFKMFNEGWILPPDQKRGGRRVERLPPLPSKKKKPGGCCFFSSEFPLIFSPQLLSTPQF